MRYLLLILLLPATSMAQSGGVGHSFKFWGQTEKTTEINVSHNNLTFHYFHNNSVRHYYKDGNKYEVVRTSTPAISFTPINVKFISFGFIISPKKFPTVRSSNANFIIKAKIPVGKLSLYYTHISNGFGLLHDVNPGVDLISIIFQPN